MKTMSRENSQRIAALIVVISVAAFVAIGCGGGGGGSTAPAIAVSTALDDGTITGILETADTGIAARAISGSMMKPAAGARVYCHPKGTPAGNLVPDNTKPFSVTNENGEFVISSVPRGKHVLVVDLDGDGSADRFIPDVDVQGGATNIGKKDIEKLDKKAPEAEESVDNSGSTSEQPDEAEGESSINQESADRGESSCSVKLDRVLYSTGDTLIMTIEGNNTSSTEMKCGVAINLRKGKEHPEQWRSDFSDPTTFVVIPANSFGSGVIMKVIPEEWALTNTNAGSDYHVITIDETGEEVGKGDNFNILHCKTNGKGKKDCDAPAPVPACFSNADCDDNNAMTSDTCMNAGEVNASCMHTAVEPEPTPACYEDAECNDGNAMTIDVCMNPGAANASCSYTAVEPEPTPACYEDAECNDGNAMTIDVCMNPGAANAACSYTAVEPEPTPACYEDAECNDGNAMTIDVCMNPGAANASCSYTNVPPAPDPVCYEDMDCSDGNANTVDVCLNPGSANASCTHTSTFVCTINADCDDNSARTMDLCIYGGTVNAFCMYEPLY